MYMYVLKLGFIMQDPTEKHFSDVCILDLDKFKYNNNNKIHMHLKQLSTDGNNCKCKLTLFTLYAKVVS